MLKLRLGPVEVDSLRVLVYEFHPETASDQRLDQLIVIALPHVNTHLRSLLVALLLEPQLYIDHVGEVDLVEEVNIRLDLLLVDFVGREVSHVKHHLLQVHCRCLPQD